MKKSLFVITFASFIGGLAHATNSCTGATYYDAATDTCIACPAGYDYNTDAGKTSINQCQIHCDAGMWVAGYTQVEYIESTGTQWIDTGIIPTVNTKVRVKFAPIERDSFGFWGARKDPYRFSATTFNNSTQFGLGMTKGTWPINRTTLQFGAVYDCVLSNGYAKINDIEYTETPITADEWLPDVGTFKLASVRNTGVAYGNRAKWYTVQLWENGTQIRNMVPVRRNSDDVLGMYDTISNTFFTNSGTGTFNVGPAIGEFCSNVGAGYYASAQTVNYGSAGIRNACPTGTTTVGYGHGADSANDCGRTLHVGDNVLYMRKNKETSPAIHIQMENGDMFYVNLSPTNHNISKLHFWHNGGEYTAYDDSLFYNERDFITGAQTTP